MSYVVTDTALPRSLDVQISLSRPQAETRTNLSVMCFVANNVRFLPDANRIRYYSTLAAVSADFDSTTEPYKAATAFFAQSPRANVMAIAEAFTTDQTGKLFSGVLSDSDITAVKSIVNGAIRVTIGGVVTTLSSLNFSTVTDLASIAAVIKTALFAAGVGNCDVVTLPGGIRKLRIFTATTGSSATIAYALPSTSPVDSTTCDKLKLTKITGASACNGYTPGTIAEELDNIRAAANSNGTNVYGWCFSSYFRDVATQTIAANWALSQTAIMVLTTNDLTAVDPSVSIDLGSVVKATGNRRAVVLYHDDINAYPDVSILAYMLHVDYRIQDSTVTAKFKQLPGIPTVTVNQTQWLALQHKGYNAYTAIGNSSKTYRDGTTEDTGYFMDSTINLDNFVEDLSVSVFNVFLRNKKIPYTRKGQMMLVDAINDTANQYIYNGTFADREVADTTAKSGYQTLPAIEVIPTQISLMSAADRASRIGPPIALVCQEAGAIHSVSIAVEVIS